MIVTVPVTPAVPAELNVLVKSAVFCAPLANAAILLSVCTAVLVHTLAGPPNVTVVVTPSVVLVAVTGTVAVLATALNAHAPPAKVLEYTNWPCQSASCKAFASIAAVCASKRQLPPNASAAPVVSIDAAISAPVAAANASTKAWPLLPSATLQP